MPPAKSLTLYGLIQKIKCHEHITYSELWITSLFGRGYFPFIYQMFSTLSAADHFAYSAGHMLVR